MIKIEPLSTEFALTVDMYSNQTVVIAFYDNKIIGINFHEFLYGEGEKKTATLEVVKRYLGQKSEIMTRQELERDEYLYPRVSLLEKVGSRSHDSEKKYRYFHHGKYKSELYNDSLNKYSYAIFFNPDQDHDAMIEASSLYSWCEINQDLENYDSEKLNSVIKNIGFNDINEFKLWLGDFPNNINEDNYLKLLKIDL